MANKEKLFTEFTAPTTQEWLDKIEVDLKGADFQKRLVWRTNEGFNVQPFYRREDLANLKTPDALPGEFPFVRGNKKDSNVWYVRQNIVVEDAQSANAKALDILNKGIDSLGFRLPGHLVSKETVEALLEGIYCDCVEVNFATCPKHSLELAQILVDFFSKKGYAPEKVVGCDACTRRGSPACRGPEGLSQLPLRRCQFRCPEQCRSLYRAGAGLCSGLG